MKEVRRGQIGPIQAKDIRLGSVHSVKADLPSLPGTHVLQLISQNPVVVAPATIDHARQCAQRLVDRLSSLPPTPEASDLLSLAFTVLHFTKGTIR